MKNIIYKFIMTKMKFLTILSKTLGRKINEKSSLSLDSLDILKLVEMNNIHFKNLKIESSSFLKCNSFKDLANMYKVEL